MRTNCVTASGVFRGTTHDNGGFHGRVAGGDTHWRGITYVTHWRPRVFAIDGYDCDTHTWNVDAPKGWGLILEDGRAVAVIENNTGQFTVRAASSFDALEATFHILDTNLRWIDP